jgi:hypothetical protein
MRAERRLRRLERSALQRRVDLMGARELRYYLDLLERIRRDGLDSVDPADRERAVALVLLGSGLLGAGLLGSGEMRCT